MIERTGLLEAAALANAASAEATGLRGPAQRVETAVVESLEALTVARLLGHSREVLHELRRRGVVRTGNAPAGDVAEWLVQRATGGELAPNSQPSWDVLTPGGERLQVKARIVTNPRTAGERQLSVFRSWTFDAGVLVLFDDDFAVWKAARVPVETLRLAARPVPHVKGERVSATDPLLEAGQDWTERLQAAFNVAAPERR